MIRSGFVKDGNLGYCSLRNDVLMGLSDVGSSTVFKLDPCHRFVRLLINCVADRSINEAQAVEMGAFFVSWPPVEPKLHLSP